MSNILPRLAYICSAAIFRLSQSFILQAGECPPLSKCPPGEFAELSFDGDTGCDVTKCVVDDYAGDDGFGDGFGDDFGDLGDLGGIGDYGGDGGDGGGSDYGNYDGYDTDPLPAFTDPPPPPPTTTTTTTTSTTTQPPTRPPTLPPTTPPPPLRTPPPPPPLRTPPPPPPRTTAAPPPPDPAEGDDLFGSNYSDKDDYVVDNYADGGYIDDGGFGDDLFGRGGDSGELRTDPPPTARAPVTRPPLPPPKPATLPPQPRTQPPRPVTLPPPPSLGCTKASAAKDPEGLSMACGHGYTDWGWDHCPRGTACQPSLDSYYMLCCQHSQTPAPVRMKHSRGGYRRWRRYW